MLYQLRAMDCVDKKLMESAIREFDVDAKKICVALSDEKD